MRLVDTARPGPLVFSSPHSGRHYPGTLLRQVRLPVRALRQGEDRHVDRLIEGVDAVHVPRVLAMFARAYVDLNRDPRELDPVLFDAPVPLARASERVSAGLGVIPRAFAPGQAIYAARLPLAEAETRIAAVHVPYHDAIARLLERARAIHGYAVLIDCHSTPSLAGAPRVILGDLHGRSAGARVADAAAAALVDVGLSVARNVPYAGAYTLERHGRPLQGIHALQIEIDRALYLDSDRLTLLPGATLLAARLTRFAVQLRGGLEGLAGTFAVAAE